MNPQQLHNSLIQATEAQWVKFISENQALMMLFEEAWQKFCAQHVQSQSIKEYAADRNLDSLRHEALSVEQMALFVAQFEQKVGNNDRPFGDNVLIQEHDWQLLD